MRGLSFITFVILATGASSFAQPAAFPQLTLKDAEKKSSPLEGKISSLSFIKKDSVKILPAQSRLPTNFYSQHLGAACKLELQMEKQTKLPIRIRLGSKEQVDYLEGKFIRQR